MDTEINVVVRQAGFNANRDHYANEDCTEYTYVYPDGTKEVLRVGEKMKDGTVITRELIITLDSLDVIQDKNDEDYGRLVDKRYQGFDPCDEQGEDFNPWATLNETKHEDDEPEEESVEKRKLRLMVENDLTENQQDFYYTHFGLQVQLETIREEEKTITGREVTHQALSNRKNKIINKGAKVLGVKRVKRRKDTKNNTETEQ